MRSKLKGNKGEWSEVYVLLKLIADGVLKSKVKSELSSYNIVHVFREEASGKKSYELLEEDALIRVDGKETRKVSRKKIEKISSLLLSEIKKLSNTNNLENEQIESLLNLLECQQLKAQSSQKTDINVIIHDHTTTLQSNLGFSVKSKVGSDSTILNAGDTTKFTFTIKGELTNDQLKELESLHHISAKGIKAYEARKIVNQLEKYGAYLEFDKVEHPVAEANFIKIDSLLPRILAEFLIKWFRDGEKEICKICDQLENSNPLNFPCSQVPEIYHFKLKKFLAEVVLGMVPGTPWTGKYDATGGFIIIEENGDVVCFHLIDRNLLENYIFDNTYLDTPSSAKFGRYGGVYQENGKLKMKLCLQIRFRDRLKL